MTTEKQQDRVTPTPANDGNGHIFDLDGRGLGPADGARSVAAKAVEPSVAEVPIIHNGPAAAAIFGASFATFMLGVLFTVSHLNSGLADWLKFREEAGAVSGLSTMATVIWLGTWAVLTPVLWKRDVPFFWLAGISAALIALGLLFTTPPVVQRI